MLERVKRDGRREHIVSLHNRATGLRVGFVEFRAPGKRCAITKEPLRAWTLHKDNAIHYGAVCAEELTSAKRPRKKTAKKSKGRERSR